MAFKPFITTVNWFSLLESDLKLFMLKYSISIHSRLGGRHQIKTLNLQIFKNLWESERKLNLLNWFFQFIWIFVNISESQKINMAGMSIVICVEIFRIHWEFRWISFISSRRISFNLSEKTMSLRRIFESTGILNLVFIPQIQAINLLNEIYMSLHIFHKHLPVWNCTFLYLSKWIDWKSKRKTLKSIKCWSSTNHNNNSQFRLQRCKHVQETVYYLFSVFIFFV